MEAFTGNSCSSRLGVCSCEFASVPVFVATTDDGSSSSGDVPVIQSSVSVITYSLLYSNINISIESKPLVEEQFFILNFD